MHTRSTSPKFNLSLPTNPQMKMFALEICVVVQNIVFVCSTYLLNRKFTPFLINAIQCTCKTCFPEYIKKLHPYFFTFLLEYFFQETSVLPNQMIKTTVYKTALLFNLDTQNKLRSPKV